MREFPEQSFRRKETRLRPSRYLKNKVAQDHRGVKSRTRPTLHFKVFDRAAVTIAEVELRHPIRKGQCNLDCFRVKGQSEPAIWNAVFAARSGWPFWRCDAVRANIFTRALTLRPDGIFPESTSFCPMGLSRVINKASGRTHHCAIA